jgi:hypothetical protein
LRPAGESCHVENCQSPAGLAVMVLPAATIILPFAQER